MAATRTFTLEPLGRFSLAEANAFGFGARDPAAGARMTLAFAADGDWEPVGVELSQAEMDGPVQAVLHGDAPGEVVAAQVARVLSLDHDGRGWDALLAQEPPLRSLAWQVPGLRPVLFHSPYEAACWAIISARLHRRQAAALRDQIAAELGTSFELHGTAMHAFPHPAALLEGLDRTPLPGIKRARLGGIAQAALDGALDIDAIQAIGPDAALVELQRLAGIGPFWASLITVRASGFADALAAEPRARARALRAYGLPDTASDAEFAALAERWRPFRTWATVLCRVAHERGLR